MKISKLSYFVLLAVMPATSLSQKLDPEDPIELYCAVVSAFGKTILEARDRGINMKNIRKDMLKIKIISENDRFQKKVDEIIEFAYLTAPDVPSEKLSDFILNDWCLGQLK